MATHFAPHLDKAIIHELKHKFGIQEFQPEHYKIIKKKHVYFPETRPDYAKFPELFEKVFDLERAKNKSLKGFIDREIKRFGNYRDIIGTKSTYFYDLIVEWIEFLNEKRNVPQPERVIQN
ncbi:MAG: hypothetical protein V4677_11130, partial [Bacteroidota bacterium]